MTEERSPVEELDDLIEDLVRALDGVAVRRRAVEELAVYDQQKIVSMLRPFLDLTQGISARVDEKLSRILDARLDAGDGR